MRVTGVGLVAAEGAGDLVAGDPFQIGTGFGFAVAADHDGVDDHLDVTTVLGCPRLDPCHMRRQVFEYLADAGT
ncbi:hypothetical protein D3C76_1759370 [compost metagenome]